jgi:hypothetical protein
MSLMQSSFFKKGPHHFPHLPRCVDGQEVAAIFDNVQTGVGDVSRQALSLGQRNVWIAPSLDDEGGCGNGAQNGQVVGKGIGGFAPAQDAQQRGLSDWAVETVGKGSVEFRCVCG